MFKNISKILKISSIFLMIVCSLIAVCYAIYLITWGFYLGALLVVIAGGVFVTIGFGLMGLARVIDNTDKIVRNIPQKENKE